MTTKPPDPNAPRVVAEPTENDSLLSWQAPTVAVAGEVEDVDHRELAATWQLLGELPAAEPTPELAARFSALLAAELAISREQRQPGFAHGAVAQGAVAGAAGLVGGAAAAGPAPHHVPGRSLLGSFTKALGALFTPTVSGSTPALTGGLRPAFVMLLAVSCGLAGFVFGAMISRERSNPELVALREELSAVRGMVSLTLLGQDSASARLRGVSYGRAAGADPELVAALLATATSDTSANVRLAALDALAGTPETPELRATLLTRLEHDPSPLVQIAIVDLLLDGAEPALPRAASNRASASNTPLLPPSELLQLLTLADDDGPRPRLAPTVRDHLRRRLAITS